jgi:hypothetical protein
VIDLISCHLGIAVNAIIAAIQARSAGAIVARAGLQKPKQLEHVTGVNLKLSGTQLEDSQQQDSCMLTTSLG